LLLSRQGRDEEIVQDQHLAFGYRRNELGVAAVQSGNRNLLKQLLG